MHATELPRPFHRHGWIYEEKYDGWRMVAEKGANQVTLTSRNGLDHSQRFPELVKAVAKLDAPSFILDGEIAIFDGQLISSPRAGSLPMASRHGMRYCGATTRAWSPKIRRQPTRPAARSRGSRSSSEAIARRLEASTRSDVVRFPVSHSRPQPPLDGSGPWPGHSAASSSPSSTLPGPSQSAPRSPHTSHR